MKNGKRLVLSCIFAVLVLPLVGGVSDASAQNLLLNAQFETGDLSNWEAFGLSGSSSVTVESPDNGPSLPGTNPVYMDNQAQALALGIKQATPIGSASFGPTFYSFDLKLGEAANGGVFFIEIFAEQDGVGVIGGTGVLGPYTPADWTTYEGEFVAPANTDFLTFQFAAITGAVVGSVSSMQVDNAYISQDGPPVSDDAVNWSEMKALYR